ncbi:MAG: hypothetical protein HC912_06635 [Saprospiraceae bacterium]|nr:hypothetical protein [Saprospiraceae bacterium]
MYGLGAAAVGAAGYLVYNQFIKPSGTNFFPPRINPEEPAPNPTPADVQVVVQNTASSSWPLRRGSKGDLVKILQTALLNMGGDTATHIRSTSMKADGTPDGDFGPGTEKALIAARYPSSVDQPTFNAIVQAGYNASAAARPAASIPNTSTGAGSVSIAPSPLAITFTLRQGDKGERVKELQEAILDGRVRSAIPQKTGINIFTYEKCRRVCAKIQGGADGIFGQGLAKALSIMGFPSTIDQTLWAKITGKTPSLNGLGGLAGAGYSKVVTTKETPVSDGKTTYRIAPNTNLGRWMNSNGEITEIWAPDGYSVYAPSENVMAIFLIAINHEKLPGKI